MIGHFIFLVLHIVAVLFFSWFLMLTIPAHLIYGAIRKREPEPDHPSPWTHVRCPDCKELVHKEASVCKHCGVRLVPQSKIRKTR